METNGEVKDRTGAILGVVVLVIFVSVALYGVIQHYKENKVGEPISVQKYNTLEKRMQYLYYCNQIQTQILYDVLVAGKLDSAFVFAASSHIQQFVIDSKNVPTEIPDRYVLLYQTDSICADWYESIPFMFMDTKHDSAWVLQSDTYKSTMEIVNTIRNKYK